MVEASRAAGNDAGQTATVWNEYVSTHLLPRLHGYEIMMAPYAIAHVKIGLKLHETGYRFDSDEPLHVFLTNALEPPQDFEGQFALTTPAIAHESEAVNRIKKDRRFTVIIGNPPYANYGRLNKIQYILALLDDYKRGLGKKNSTWTMIS